VTEPWLAFARRVSDALGLVHFGIDLKATSLDAPPESATVIEVNASPLLSQIYRMGHREVAVDCQARVLEHLLA
jgi:glutathione synthase/RimK-type ligase-like ATP-grasp enzyme